MPPACSPRNRKGNKSIMGTARSKQVMINVSLDAFAHMIEYVQHVNTNKETSGNMHTNTLICTDVFSLYSNNQAFAPTLMQTHTHKGQPQQ